MDPATLHDSTAGQILAIVITFPALALIAVGLRLYTRLVVIKSAASEDLCIGVAMILSIAVTVATAYEVHYGLGQRLALIASTKPQIIEPYFKSLYASIIIYNFGLLFTKLSILLQYLRICVPGVARTAIFVVMAIVVAYGIETFFSGTFTCTPIAFFWDDTIPGGHCVNKWPLYFANGGINIATDFAILILPVFILKDLIMPRFQKMFLMAIIALGGAACIASIFRLHMLYKLSKSSDFYWDGPGTATWSCIELNVGIICASVSTLRPLFSGILPTMFGSRPSYVARNQYVSTGQKKDIQTSTGARSKSEDEMTLTKKEDELEMETDLKGKGSNQDIKVFTEYKVQHANV